MIRKTLTILSLIGLLLSVTLLFPTRWTSRGPWGASGGTIWCYPAFVSTPVFGIILYICCRPLHHLHHHHRRKRKKLGLCLECGYDLRGSKDVCPECGTAFQKPIVNEGEPTISRNEKGV